MKLTTMRYCGRLGCGGFLLGMPLTALPLTASRVLIYNASSAGSTVDVIDSATNKVVQVIESIELPHDVAFSADGSRVYISDEAEDMLDVMDQKTGQIIKKVPLSGKPNTDAGWQVCGRRLDRSEVVNRRRCPDRAIGLAD